MSSNRNYRFSDAKNALLQAERGISFEDAIFALENGGLLDIVDNDLKHYPAKHVMVLWIKNYAWLVPFFIDENDGALVLKTVYPSRKLTKEYTKEPQDD